MMNYYIIIIDICHFCHHVAKVAKDEYVITPFRVLLLVYCAPEGGGLISRNNTIKGVIKCLLPVARLRDAFATRARPEMAILRLWSRRDG